MKQGRDYIFGLDGVRSANPPHAGDRIDWTDEMEQEIDLMDGLAYQRTAALHCLTALDRACVVFVRAMPLHVSIGLKNPPEPACNECALQKQNRVVETMLAYDAKLDSRLLRGADHSLRRVEIDRHRLLHQHMLSGQGA